MLVINLDYLYNPDAAKEFFSKNYFIDKKLGFSVIENGMILPYKKIVDGKLSKDGWGFGGIVDSEGEFVRGSHVHSSIGESYIPPLQDIKHSSETVIYLGMFYSTWGHVITDNIRRLWFLRSEDFKNQFNNLPMAYTLCTKRISFTLENYKNFRRLLEILEVDIGRLQLIEQPTRFEKIILPDESFFDDTDNIRKFTNEYRETIDRVRDFALKNRTPTSTEKIYYFHGRSQIGEERLAEYFKSKGYEIISPEKLTLDEQLNLLINCESFASTIGSSSHNSLFLRDGTQCIFIPRNVHPFNGYQRTCNQVNSAKVNYINSSLPIFGKWYSNHCFIVSEQLKNFFGDKSEDYCYEDFKIFLQYVKDSINKGLLVNLGQVKLCGENLEKFIKQLRQHDDLIKTYDIPFDFEKLQLFLPQGINYKTHVAKIGWSCWSNEEQISNPLDQKHDIQAIKINFLGHKVYYSVYYNEAEGWSEEVQAPKMSGTTGKRKSIFGIKIRLDEAGTKEFDIIYRVHKFDDTWTDWAKNGETLYSYGVKLNAIQIKLEPKRT